MGSLTRFAIGLDMKYEKNAQHKYDFKVLGMSDGKDDGSLWEKPIWVEDQETEFGFIKIEMSMASIWRCQMDIAVPKIQGDHRFEKGKMLLNMINSKTLDFFLLKEQNF